MPSIALCSTPCGIEDGIRSLTLSATNSAKGAQRLAASKMESVYHRRQCCRLHQVLNALRHRRWNQITGVVVDRVKYNVLNALRHRRWNQETGWKTLKALEKCSTPCGIEDGIRLYASRQSAICLGAQRLAASKMESGDCDDTEGGRF